MSYSNISVSEFCLPNRNGSETKTAVSAKHLLTFTTLLLSRADCVISDLMVKTFYFNHVLNAKLSNNYCFELFF